MCVATAYVHTQCAHLTHIIAKTIFAKECECVQ